MKHLSEREIWAVATGQEPDAAWRSHATGCPRCRGEVEATRRVLASISDLGAAVAAPADLGARLESRLDRLASPGGGLPGRRISSRGSRRLLEIAAALLMFATGAAAHAVWSGDVTSGRGELERPGAALEVQRTGSAYVAAIARLVDDSSRLSTEDLRTGREVALAAMSGAAFELRYLTPGPGPQEIHRLVERARIASAEPAR